MNAEFKVWWVPQVPMKAFEVSVPDIATGRLLCDTLGKYDAFQLENQVKPDYCNAGGLMFRHAITENEWWDWPEDEEEAACLINEMTKDPANG
jgi:hypothetical protein